ncbi:MAG: FAD-dependent monooxygenase [Actinomycetota bacterium]|nr:FAD-dependent monooxygenase [Actinomycetota bacterium]
MASVDVAVLIVGGGPVGLTARALLARWGVRSLLVEKRGELSPFPRSRLVNVRSMEIFRQLGLGAEIKALAFGPEYGRIRFCDTLLDRDFAMAEMVGVNAAIAESPEIGVVTSQDRLEPVLVDAANAELRFGVELIDVSEALDRVSVSLIDHGRGETSRVRARYVLAADGASSTVRERLGIGTSGPGPIASFTTVVFDADLAPWCAHRPAGVYFTARGAFAPLYPEGGWAWFLPTPEDADRTDWRDLVTRALGPIDVDVLRVQHWTMNAFVAERFCDGRVLLAGDAAHAIPITGGLGMNAGIADAHNLCWKLAGIVHGWAQPGLLDTYETERKPVADRTLQQAAANTKLVMEVQGRGREQRATGASPTEIELPWSERYFAQLGLVLGVSYNSGAVLTDGTDAPVPSDPVTDYIPTGRPGHRAPHVWLDDGRSSLDALGEWFTLLTPDLDSWGQHTATSWPLHVETLSQDQADLCGLGPRGALLVRPDGHVGARWRDGPPSDAALQRALAVISFSRSP